jgi:nucleoside-diphosphate-sugar epimerase
VRGQYLHEVNFSSEVIMGSHHESKKSEKHILVTGGAGFIGSALTAKLLNEGYRASVLDNLFYGGDALIPFIGHPRFEWVQADAADISLVKSLIREGMTVVHLAGIAGFPACQTIGRELAYRYNVDTAAALYQAAFESGAVRFIFPSTYTAFGNPTESDSVTEQSPPNPQTLYAETKIAAEEKLKAIANPGCDLLILRMADIFGISGRTRFDALANQFVWNAVSRREIIIYQKGYRRSFLHIQDAVMGIILGIEASASSVKGEIFNLGDNRLNYTKDEIALLIQELIPGTRIIHKDMTFGGYRRDIHGDFSRIQKQLGFKARFDLPHGISEIKQAILTGLIRDPGADFHYNARFAVQ